MLNVTFYNYYQVLKRNLVKRFTSRAFRTGKKSIRKTEVAISRITTSDL